MIPAKVIPDKNTACVCYGGEEHYKEDVEVLRAGSFVWEFASSGNIPEGAVSCGQTADGELLYVGRCLHQGTQTPGMNYAKLSQPKVFICHLKSHLKCFRKSPN